METTRSRWRIRYAKTANSRARHIDVDVAAGDRPSARVEPERARLQDGRALDRSASGQHAKAGHQHSERERFRDVVVGAGGEGLDLVVVGISRRQHEDRRPVVGLPQRREHLPAVHAGHHPIEDDDVVVVLGGQPEAVDTVVGHVDRAPLGFEAQPKTVGEPHFVIDHRTRTDQV